MRALTRNISEPLVAGFYRFGVNCATLATKLIFAGSPARRGIQDQARFTAERQQAHLLRWREEGHIDVSRVDHVQYPPSGGQHFARLSNAILDAAVARSVGYRQYRRGSADGSLGGFNAGFSLNNAGTSGFNGGAGGRDLRFRRFQRARAPAAARRHPAAERRRRHVAKGCWNGRGGGGIELRGAASPPLRWRAFSPAAGRVSIGGGNRALRFFDCAAASGALLIEYPRIHPRQHHRLYGRTALFDQNRLDTPGNFGGDIDFRHLDAAVLAAKPGGSPAGRNILLRR